MNLVTNCNSVVAYIKYGDMFGGNDKNKKHGYASFKYDTVLCTDKDEKPVE